MHENMVLMLTLFFKLGKPRKIIKTYKKYVSTSSPRLPRARVVVSIPNTHNFGNFVTQNRKCSCTKVIRSGLYYILKHIKTIRNRYTMHGNMVLVLTIFSKSEKSREKKKVPISDQDCLGTAGWVSIPNTVHANFRILLRKIENARVQKLSNRDYILFLNTFKPLETDTLCTEI